MTGEKVYVPRPLTYRQRMVTFGGNQKGRILGIGKIGKNHFPSIDNALYVEGLKHNLLSIQLCDSGYIVSFNKDKCTAVIAQIKTVSWGWFFYREDRN